MDIMHDINEHKETILCPDCGDIFTSKLKLRIHISSKHKPKVLNFHCKYCDYKTHAKNMIVEHERTHTGEKPFKCAYCPSAFAQRTSLNVHINSHHREQQPISRPVKDRDKFTVAQDEEEKVDKY